MAKREVVVSLADRHQVAVGTHLNFPPQSYLRTSLSGGPAPDQRTGARGALIFGLRGGGKKEKVLRVRAQTPMDTEVAEPQPKSGCTKRPPAQRLRKKCS